MPKTAVTQWDTTAANNQDVGGISILGTAPVSNFDNALREIMAQIATFNTGATFTGTTTLGVTAISSSAAGNLLTITSTDAGASAGPAADYYRNSASPAVNDIIWYYTATGNNSSAVKKIYFDQYVQISDPTAGSEDSVVGLRTIVAGASNPVLTMGAGIQIGSPTGGDKGAGTINATGYYLNGTALFPTSTDNAVARFDGTAGALQNSTMTIADTGNVTINGTLTVSDQIIASVSAAEIYRTTSTAFHIGKTGGNLTNAGTSFFATGASNGLFQCTRDSDIVGQFNVINPVGTETVLEFMTSGTAKGSISINGSTTAYNTSSDRRLKENPRPFDAGAILDKLKIYQFDWKAGGSGYGVFAQEAVKVFPDAVAKGKGKKMWQVDYSKFVPLLLQEVKALREEIRALKALG